MKPNRPAMKPKRNLSMPRFKRFVSATLLGLACLTAVTENPAYAKFSYPTNHPDLQWLSIETEHFVIHYPVSKRDPKDKHWFSTEWAARKCAKIAEEMWPKMCAHFNYFLKERVHIVLLNQADDLAGFTIPSWDWIEISANPGYDFYRARGRMEWFSDVLVHEFAHVVSLKAYATLSEGVFQVPMGGLMQDGINDADTGINFSIADGDSVFWTEGGAEYYSDDTGYNWWTASRDMNIRMTVLEDRLLTFDEWDTRAGKWGWNDGERYYQQGYSFALYLRERFGNDTYAKFANEFGKGWRPDFDTVIEDVLGVTEEQLYNDWVAYLKEKYNAQYDRVKARGEVVGLDVLAYGKPWLYTDPEGRDEWLSSKGVGDKDTDAKWKRERAQQRTGTWSYEPRTSDDGRFVGFVNPPGAYDTVAISRWDERTETAFTGQSPTDPAIIDEMTNKSATYDHVTGSAWDFIPGRDAVVVTGHEDNHPQPFLTDLLGLRLEADGYNWNQLMVWDFPLREKREGNRTVETYDDKKFLGRHVQNKKDWHPIPNTLRGSDPTASPDGKKVAFFEYNDGGMNLVTINLDGTDKKYITNWHDGTWLQRADWSPDGTKIVFAVFRNYQQNLYIADAQTGELTPIMQDSWEEMDAHWAKDGNIYFSADCDGIFNIYKYDPRDGHFTQLTNVIGGAQSPWVTPEGNLLYNYYTAFGWKIHGLAKDELMNAPADSYFDTQFDGAVVKASLGASEDLSMWTDKTHEYRVGKSLMAPAGYPELRMENDGPSWGLQGGATIFLQDYVEKHTGAMVGLLGQDALILGQYAYQGWYPTIGITAYMYRGKYVLNYLFDADDDPGTTDDQSTYELKQSYSVEVMYPYITYPWNDRLTTTLQAQLFEYDLKSQTDPGFKPYMQRFEPGLDLSWSNIATDYYGRSANPPKGRYLDLFLGHGFTDIVFEDYGGVNVDDGELFDQYQFNRAELRWTEQINIPTFGGVPLLQKAKDMNHRLQIDARFGWTDRNVTGNDEMHAGGQHPYQYGYGSLTPNTLFAGYPGYSLSGETLGILNVAYRFPLAHPYQFHKLGPLSQVNGIYMQFGGTAGNLWSFRPPQDDASSYVDQYDQTVAYDPDDIEREIPLVDKAYKNGNYLLFDAQAEVRVPMILFNTSSWDSFLRVAYGFNEISGYGDVNGDNVYQSTDSGLGDGLSTETEKPGVRFYLGLGTGW
jgi:hypothetical protein